MPRPLRLRKAVTFVIILVVTWKFVRLIYEPWDKEAAAAGSATLTRLGDESFGKQQPAESSSHKAPERKTSKANGGTKARRTAIVTASVKSDDTTWLDEYFPEWERNIYHVDDPNAPLTVPTNKGRESMAYLTYIIDHYASLPDYVLFIHSGRYQWHNDDPDYDGVPMLRHLQLPYIEEEGYVTIRCTWILGCPVELRPHAEADDHQNDTTVNGQYKRAFKQLFPGERVPDKVAVSCCAQFAVTKETIRKRSKEQYEKWRDWLMQTELNDYISGRIFEYVWHIIFGKPAVYCPRVKDCYCKLFGLCNLTCLDDGTCEGRYTLAKYTNLPKGWPYVDWDGKKRQRAVPEE